MNNELETKSVAELGGNLQLVSDTYEVEHILDSIGVEYDNESIVLEDSYGALFVDVGEGEYTEVWGIHQSVPYLSTTAYRLL